MLKSVHPNPLYPTRSNRLNASHPSNPSHASQASQKSHPSHASHPSQTFHTPYIFFISTLIFSLLWSPQSKSLNLQIVSVKKNIPLSDSDPIFKDFYINGGTEAGLQKNMLLKVQRKISVKDAQGAQNIGEIYLTVGDIQIIEVQKGLSIAREKKLISKENSPILEHIGIMAGDSVTTKSSIQQLIPNK